MNKQGKMKIFGLSLLGLLTGFVTGSVFFLNQIYSLHYDAQIKVTELSRIIEELKNNRSTSKVETSIPLQEFQPLLFSSAFASTPENSSNTVMKKESNDIQSSIREAIEDPKCFIQLVIDNPESEIIASFIPAVFTQDNSHYLLDHIGDSDLLLKRAMQLGAHEEFPDLFVIELSYQLESNHVVNPELLYEVSSSLVEQQGFSTLSDYAVNGYNQWVTLDTLEKLGYDNLVTLADKAFQRTLSRSNSPQYEHELVMISHRAARLGNRDALELFIARVFASGTINPSYRSLIGNLFDDAFSIYDFNENSQQLRYQKESKTWAYTG